MICPPQILSFYKILQNKRHPAPPQNSLCLISFIFKASAHNLLDLAIMDVYARSKFHPFSPLFEKGQRSPLVDPVVRLKE